MLALLGGIKLGPFLLKYSWIGAALGFFIASFHIRRFSVQDSQESKILQNKVLDMYWNGVVIWLLAFKMAKVVVAPAAFFQNPILEFFSTPAPNADVVAWIVVLIYFIYKRYRLKISIFQMTDILSPAFVLGFGVYELLALQLGTATQVPWGIHVGQNGYHPVNFYIAICLLLAYWIIIRRKDTIRIGSRTAQSLIAFGFSWQLSTYFLVPGQLYFGLTKAQWLYLAILVIGILLFYQTTMFSKTQIDTKND
ncbi:hypothetical protein LSG31_09050 [Fodinisporobacter ferrooxydans]|uniref:Prolipoprotein diacylglyceryl transferase n=1 Tax=Fodinisporobacter ferrooxydans TaxID=2901836 RepID=A0ABY4CPG7_9BACL|nr:hypothetical protein LSG31_09050 [Alicyclobacillaceae bacterium MYW30-H2]